MGIAARLLPMATDRLFAELKSPPDTARGRRLLTAATAAWPDTQLLRALADTVNALPTPSAASRGGGRGEDLTALAIKERGNMEFRAGSFRAALADYEAALRAVPSIATASVLLANRAACSLSCPSGDDGPRAFGSAFLNAIAALVLDPLQVILNAIRCLWSTGKPHANCKLLDGWHNVSIQGSIASKPRKLDCALPRIGPCCVKC